MRIKYSGTPLPIFEEEPAGISRKQFLGLVGSGIAAVTGIATLATRTASKPEDSYGQSNYGGKTTKTS